VAAPSPSRKKERRHVKKLLFAAKDVGALGERKCAEMCCDKMAPHAEDGAARG